LRALPYLGLNRDRLATTNDIGDINFDDVVRDSESDFYLAQYAIRENDAVAVKTSASQFPAVL